MFNLTRQEKTVLLFIAGVMLVGSLLNMTAKHSPALRRFFDFTEQRQNPKIDVNKAGLEHLKKVPYVGEKIAKEIIKDREQKHGFKSLDELLSIKGIGPRRLELLKKHLVINP